MIYLLHSDREIGLLRHLRSFTSVILVTLRRCFVLIDCELDLYAFTFLYSHNCLGFPFENFVKSCLYLKLTEVVVLLFLNYFITGLLSLYELESLDLLKSPRLLPCPGNTRHLTRIKAASYNICFGYCSPPLLVELVEDPLTR